jgi:hypothetical protein
MNDSEVLFTQQEHHADKAGLHYDYRIVIGDKAYSWASFKNVPEPGKSIIFHEQPVHDREYALSPKVVIPSGQYGGGTTYLKWVKKGKLAKGKDYFTVETASGEKYLLKHIPSYGDKHWLFKNLTENKKDMKENKYLEKIASVNKEASFLGGAAIGHLAQNAITNLGLRSKTVANNLATHFSNGYMGGEAAGHVNKIKKAILGAVSPDLAIAGNVASKLGSHLREIAPSLSSRDKVGLRMLSQGRFNDLHKYGLSKNPTIVTAVHALKHHTGVDMTGLLDHRNANRLEAIWKSKKYPLLNNIASHLSKGVPSHNLVQAKPSATAHIVGSAGAVAVEPGSGLLSLTKHVASTEAFNKNKYGKKISDTITSHLISEPIEHGWEQGASYKNGLKAKLTEHLVNPTSAHLQRTSAALSAAMKNDASS